MAPRGGSGFLGPWEWYRKVGLGASVAALLFFTVLVTLPIGVAAVIFLVTTSLIWKPIGVVTDPRLGTYMMNTMPYYLAKFFTGYNSRRNEALSPVVSLGFGAPTADPDHELEAGFFPPTRLSAYWSLLGALILAGLDWPLQFVRFPFWHGWTLPWYISYGISVVGWLVAIQSILHIRRLQADGAGIIGIEPAPATMFSRVNRDGGAMSSLIKASLVGLAGAAVFAVLWWAFSIPSIIVLPIIVVCLCFGFTFTGSKLMMDSYRSKWLERKSRREYWEGALSYLKDSAPILIAEMELPTFEEHVQNTEGMEEPPPYRPMLKLANFMFPPHTTFDSFAGKEAPVLGMVGASHAVFSPIPSMDPDTGEDIPGSIGNQGVRLWWTEEHLTVEQLLEPDLDEWLREFGIRSIIVPAISACRGIGYCNMISCALMTRPNSSDQILEIRLSPGEGVPLSSFVSNVASLQNTLGIPWIRFLSEPSKYGNVIVAMVGAHPSYAEALKFVNPASIVRKSIDTANWTYFFQANRLVGDSGTPRLLNSKKTTNVVSQLTFDLPPGMSYKAIEGSVDSLKTTSGNNFIEPTLGEPSSRDAKTALKKRATREVNLHISSSKFSMVVAKENPLNRLFSLENYRKDVILGRVPGQEKLTWSPGVMANDELGIDDFNGAEPHLLIAGSSGSGKSVIVKGMLLQMFSNNGPEDLISWMIEPKIGLQSFRNLDNVTRFVDSWTGFDGSKSENFQESVAEMSEQAVDEMKRRNRILAEYNPRGRKMIPEKLAESRDIARMEGPDPITGEPHPMMMPFMNIMVEECATVFADAASKEEREAQAVSLANFARIAREGRSAGIHMSMTTQYPTNASIPSVIRKQMRRIGLACQDSMASRVVIDQNGLETTDMRTVKGSGMILNGSAGYRMFRGFFLQNGNPDRNEANDVVDILESLPKNDISSNVPIVVDENNPLEIPEPDDSVFKTWERHTGRLLDQAIDASKKTKDITEEEMIAKGILKPRDS